MRLLLVNPKLVASLIIGEEEFCMLTERAIEEPNLRRSAEMKDMLYDPLCLVFQPSSKLELIHIWD